MKKLTSRQKILLGCVSMLLAMAGDCCDFHVVKKDSPEKEKEL